MGYKIKSFDNYSVGIGYDLHRFVKTPNVKKLVLAGVEIKYPFGLKGHSDGDVVLHSICDSILGACGLPDIGELFPDTDSEIKGIDSKVIAKKVLDLMKQKKFKIINIDTVVVCNKPKISLIKKNLLKSLQEIFNIKNVNIKGKTTEGKKCDYIETFSVVLVKKFFLKNENL